MGSWPWSWWLKKEAAGSNISFQPYPTSRGGKRTNQKHNKYHQSPFIHQSHLLHSRGLFSHSILYKTKKRHLHPQDSNKNTIIHCHPLPLTNQIHLLTIFPSPSKIHPLLTFPHTHFHQLPTRTQISQRPSSLIIDSMPIFSSSFLPSPSTC